VTLIPQCSPQALRNRYRAADAFVFPSWFEGLSLVLLEAMACGLPVIASRSSGGGDVVTPACGRLIEAGDTDALVATLQWFAEHRDQAGAAAAGLCLAGGVPRRRVARPRGRSSIARLIMLGSGELEPEVRTLAASDRDRFRVQPFENQQRMPVAYRLADLFVLPSARGESWGLAVNEAMSCGRAVLVSDRVGCAADVVDPSCGAVFASHEPRGLSAALDDLTARRDDLRAMGRAAAARAWAFDVAQAEAALIGRMGEVCR
jgi:glycosyltransferase involved in cell wall biosynthesis